MEYHLLTAIFGTFAFCGLFMVAHAVVNANLKMELPKFTSKLPQEQLVGRFHQEIYENYRLRMRYPIIIEVSVDELEYQMRMSSGGLTISYELTADSVKIHYWLHNNGNSGFHSMEELKPRWVHDCFETRCIFFDREKIEFWAYPKFAPNYHFGAFLSMISSVVFIIMV